jgi:hypothetical protein
MKIGSVKVKNKTKKEGSTSVTFSSSFNTSKERINNNDRVYFNFINSISPHSRKTYEFIVKNTCNIIIYKI